MSGIQKWIFSNKLPSWSTPLPYSFSKHDLVWKQLQVQDLIYAITMLNCAEHQSGLISWGNMNDVCFLLWGVKLHYLKNLCIKYLRLFREIWDPIIHHYGIVKKSFVKQNSRKLRRNCERKLRKMIFTSLVSNFLIKKKKVIILSYAD